MRGFYMTFSNKGIFLEDEGTNITDKIARKFINWVCDYKDIGEGIRKKALYDNATLKDFKKRINKADLIKCITENGYNYYSIKGNNFTVNYPVDDFKKDIILLK